MDSSSSQTFLEAAEETIGDLRTQAKMWERTARKLMLEMDYLKKEHVELSRSQGNQDMEFTEACAERDGLRKEVEQLKQLLAKAKMKPPPLDNPSEGTWQMVKELEREISFQKETSRNLTMQLQRSQESNIELVTVLQDLEETLEKQKVEIESLYDMESRFGELEDAMEVSAESNKNLMVQVQDLLNKVQELELALEEERKQKNLNSDTQSTDRDSNREVESIKMEMEGRIRKLTEELDEVRAASDHKYQICELEAELKKAESDLNISAQEIEKLKLELEVNVTEMSKQLDESKAEIQSLETIMQANEEEVGSLCFDRSEASDHESQLNSVEESYKKLLTQIDSDYNDSLEKAEKLRTELEAEVAELKEELSDRKAEIEILDACLHAKEEEIGQLQRHARESEAKIFDLKEEKCQLENNMETIMEENDVAARRLDDSQQEIMMLRTSVESHVASNNALETKCLELEGTKQELELHSSELKHENEQQETRLSDLEAKMLHLKRERESTEQELEDSKSEATSLKDEIARLSDEIETERMNMKDLLMQINNECITAHEENECLKNEIQKLQATYESFREEHNAILVNYEELVRENTDLESQRNHLDATLKNAQLSLDEFSKRIISLEEENECLEEERHKSQATTEAFVEEHNVSLVKNEELAKMNTDLKAELKDAQLSLAEFAKRVMGFEEKINSLEQDTATKVKDLASGLDELNSKHEEQAANQSVARLTTSEMEFSVEELAAFKENQEKLKSEKRRMAYRFEDYKSSEAKLRTTINELELKLTVSDYKHQILKEEAMKLKVQLLKLGPIHEQVLALKTELNAAKSDKNKLKSSLNLVTTECQQLEAEKSSLLEEIAVLRKCVHQLEEHKRQRFALEEKLKILEKDLMAKEALWQRDEQANDELNKIRKANKQLQKIIEELEDEKDDYAAKARSLEEELVMIQEEEFNLSSSSNVVSIPISSSLLIMKLNFFHLSETFFPDLNRTKTEMLDHLRSNFPSLGMKNPH
ncbi:hypothetical protein LINGRAHAP2_LOCUS12867 [Linum grandiflorum]